MSGYKDMIEMIGKFKHVPEVLANPDNAYNRYATGGTLNQSKNTTYTSIDQSGIGTSVSPTTPTSAKPMDMPYGIGNGQLAPQWFTAVDGGDGGMGTPRRFQPYYRAMGDDGNLLTGTSASGTISDDIRGGGGAGGGYQGLTPYGAGRINHPLIVPRVTSFKKGGKMYLDGGKKKAEPLETPQNNTSGVWSTIVGAAKTLVDKERNSTEVINPNVSNESYQSFSSQLKSSENSSNKGYDKKKKLWFPFDVGVNEEKNIGWGINMSTFSDEDKKRMSKGVTSEEIEDIFNKRISKHLNKSKEKITEMGGDWDSLPDNAKLALADFSYNLGSLNKFPKFTQAIIDNDLETAKKEYKRYYTDKGVKKEMTSRNKDIYEMIFENAKGDGKIYKKGGTYVTPTQDTNQKLTPSESNLYGYEDGGTYSIYDENQLISQGEIDEIVYDNQVKEKTQEIFNMINPYNK